MEKPTWPVLVPILLIVLVAVAATAWLFLYKKEYNFVVEAPCDPSQESCFHRDCTEEECPPNGLEDFKLYTISAADFEACTDGTCVAACAEGSISCEVTTCDVEAGDSCSETPEQSAE